MVGRLKNKKRTWNLYTNRNFTQDGIWNCEICNVYKEQRRKKEITDWKELNNQESLKTLREKESYKYQGILKAETIKQTESVEKLERSTSERPRNYWKVNSTAGIYFVKYSGPSLNRINEEQTLTPERMI